MPLHTSYRPDKLENFYGNADIKDALQLLFERTMDRPQSFMFTGPPGMGKTTLALVVKEAYGVHDVDYYEYNAANNRGIDTIRQIQTELAYAPSKGDFKLYLLDECHRQTVDALNALLKIIEEPMPHVLFVLCTAEPDTIKETLRKALKRRCHYFEVKPLVRGEMFQLFNDVLTAENVTGFPNEILEEIINRAEGSPGVGMKMLDSVIDIPDTQLAIRALENMVIGEASIVDICRLILDENVSPENKWKKMQTLLTNLDSEAEGARRAILNYFEKVMFNKQTDIQYAVRVAGYMSFFVDSFMYLGRAGLTMACCFACAGK